MSAERSIGSRIGQQAKKVGVEAWKRADLPVAIGLGMIALVTLNPLPALGSAGQLAERAYKKRILDPDRPEKHGPIANIGNQIRASVQKMTADKPPTRMQPATLFKHVPTSKLGLAA